MKNGDKRVLFAIGGFDRGGKERRLLSLIGILSQNGYEIGLIASSESPHLAEAKRYCHVYYDYRKGDFLFNLREHRRAVREFRPGLIHSWNGSNTLYAILAARNGDCRIITSEITNSRLLRVFSREFWMTRVNFAFSDLVLSNSVAGLRAKRAPRRKGEVIYNGYRLERLEAINRRKYADLACPGSLNVVMAARFCKEKDFSTVLRTAKMAEDADMSLSFVLAGEGPDLGKMRSQATIMNLRNVQFPGHISDIDNLLCHMDVGILLTDTRFHQEGISNSIIEYMAHGLPVIATEGFALSEVLSDGTNGMVVGARDPAGLLEKLRYIETDTRLIGEMSGNARRTVKERFNLADMGENFMRTYERLTSAS